MARVSGIGQAKLARYGAAFLQVFAAAGWIAGSNSTKQISQIQDNKKPA
jgi:hypothetical protein